MNNKRTLRQRFESRKWICISFLLCFNQLAFAKASGPATLQSVSPALGSLLGGAKVTIAGHALYLPESVTFGGVPATVLSSGVAFIDVRTPAHAPGAVDVKVVNSGGFTTVLTAGYTYDIAVATSTLPDAIAGISYNQTLTAEGGVEPYHWQVVAGSLPSGLSLNSSTGAITGQPAANYGTATFTVQATDSSSHPLSATFSLSITVDIGLKPGPVPASFFGISALNSGIWPSVSFGAFGKGGQTTWPYLEPAKGQFNWAKLDAFVAAAKTHGFSVYWTNHEIPEWAAANTSTCTTPQTVPVCTSTVANIADWDEFCTALVQRYKGQIMMYELWNEPNTAHFTGTTAQMVELTQHLYNAVRANDPHALIASPSATNTTWLGNYFALGGPTGVDVVTVHGYLPTVSNNEPETLATYKVIPWHAVMLQYGLQNKPIWDTEGSWGSDSTAALDPDAEAAFLARYYLLHWSAGVTAFYWYAWDSTTWGSLTNSGAASKAGIAYGQLDQWMTGATMPQPCSVNGTVYTCPLTRPNGYSAEAVWDSGRSCTSGGGCPTSNYSAPKSFVQYRDLTGAVTSIQSGQVVLIGAKPILLENKNP